MLKVTDLQSGYGKLQILEGVSIEASPGRITVIVGPNGSGKSTLLKSIAGIANIYSGTVELEGRVLSGLSTTEIARSGLAYLPQTENVFTNLSVKENLRLSGYTVAGEEYQARMAKSLEVFPQLSRYLGSKASNLSGGERQMLAMGMAMVRNPVAVLFDEPTANLSPKISTQVLQTIATLTKELNLITLLVEQNAKRALEMGDTAYLMVSGKTVFGGPCKDLLAHKELGRLYLGMQVL